MLEIVKSKTDLVVFLDEELKFHQHVTKAVNEASRMLGVGLVRATFTCSDEVAVHQLFTMMVHPHLEYGNSIWHPS